jgi:(p)ppGpp synthase/HD superfamily hydrolase
MPTLSKAIEIAQAAHLGQIDKSGAPYIMHVMRVMNSGKSEIEKICGVLHDIVEDTPWTFEMLEAEGFSKEVIDVLKLVTKESEQENYDHFIDRILTNKTAIAVKLNDLRDNMDITRLPHLTQQDLPRLNKYLRAYKKLVNNE